MNNRFLFFANSRRMQTDEISLNLNRFYNYKIIYVVKITFKKLCLLHLNLSKYIDIIILKIEA